MLSGTWKRKVVPVSLVLPLFLPCTRDMKKLATQKAEGKMRAVPETHLTHINI